MFAARCANGASFEKPPAAAPLGCSTRIDKVMVVTLDREIERLERQLGFLATIGSTAPFVGLFGTVWGIMTRFRVDRAAKKTKLAVVAPGIAEALLATAIGLVAAIPAVIAYNKLSGDDATPRRVTRLRGRVHRGTVARARERRSAA